MIPIVFKVTCPNTNTGQILKLVGSTSQLGNWNPHAGLTLVTNSAEFPVWRAGILMSPPADSGIVEYKYVLVNMQDPSH